MLKNMWFIHLFYFTCKNIKIYTGKIMIIIKVIICIDYFRNLNFRVEVIFQKININYNFFKIIVVLLISRDNIFHTMLFIVDQSILDQLHIRDERLRIF